MYSQSHNSAVDGRIRGMMGWWCEMLDVCLTIRKYRIYMFEREESLHVPHFVPLSRTRPIRFRSIANREHTPGTIHKCHTIRIWYTHIYIYSFKCLAQSKRIVFYVMHRVC